MVLADIERCFGGAIPAVLATASADGVVNITYLSRAHQVDHERVALSNQFMSKTSRNLAGNPRASLLLMDPLTHDEYRLALVYERTDRRGGVFERLRADIDALAVLEDLQDVYRLRAADVYRVVSIEHLVPNTAGSLPSVAPSRVSAEPMGLAELASRVARAGDLDTLVETALEGLDRLLGYRHTVLLLLDEEGTRLYAIGSRGFDEDSIGAEVFVGQGQIGLAAERCEPLRIGGLHQMKKYARAIRHRHEHEHDEIGPGHEMPLPAVAGVQSRIVVPAMARGELIGVLVAESSRPVAFEVADEQVLCAVASLLASSIEHVRLAERVTSDEPVVVGNGPGSPAVASEKPVIAVADGPVVRFFPVDGSVFLDGDYLIKGVAGRILWSLLAQWAASGRVDFTNRELRLDPGLDLPGFKDNLESRLILLKRRLDERAVPIRLEKTGRGRFRLVVSAEPRLESVDA
jgi:hypothetical protein